MMISTTPLQSSHGLSAVRLGEALPAGKNSQLPFPFADDELPQAFGRYQLIRVLGVGGMGSVYLATDSVLQRHVALKIPMNATAGGAAIDRFVDEARAAAKIRHPNVCTVYDIGCHSGIPYLTMEYVDGLPLDRFVAANQPLPPVAAANIVIRIAAAIHAAHQQGVIHRDVKPANILMRNRSQPVVTDFGLAHRIDLHRAGSPAAKILGSPSYMSPEQVRGEVAGIGPATDVYGLGTVLFELITGCRPFQGTVTQIYSQVLTQPASIPSNLAGGIDPRLDEICRRSLAKRPEDRFPDMIAMSRELGDFLRQSVETRRKTPDPSARQVVANPQVVVNPQVLSNARPLRIAAGTAAAIAPSAFHGQVTATACSKFRAASPVHSSVARCHRNRSVGSRQKAGLVSGLLAVCLALFVGVIGSISLSVGDSREVLSGVDRGRQSTDPTADRERRRANRRPLVHEARGGANKNPPRSIADSFTAVVADIETANQVFAQNESGIHFPLTK